MVSCCCACLSSLWVQMLKAFKSLGDRIRAVSQSSARNPAADGGGGRKLSSMDITVLEEQYHCIQQEQRLRTHIIVYKTGENNPMTTETLVTTVPVNKKVQKAKAFEERIPIRGVTLDILDNGNLHDQTDPWHLHLDIHRLVQTEYQCQPFTAAQDENGEFSFDNERLALMAHTVVQRKDSTESSELKVHNEQVHSNDVGSPTDEKYGSLRNIQRKPSWKPLTSASLIHHQLSSMHQISGSNKLYYYPFPQKKGPRISEAARRLGLYVTH